MLKTCDHKPSASNTLHQACDLVRLCYYLQHGASQSASTSCVCATSDEEHDRRGPCAAILPPAAGRSRMKSVQELPQPRCLYPGVFVRPLSSASAARGLRSIQNKGHSTLDVGSPPAARAKVIQARGAITRIRAQGKASSNTLATGDQGGTGQACSPHMHHLLNDTIWLRVLEQQGAAVLEELLSQCSVFVQVGGPALLQISGPPLSGQASLKRRRAPSAAQASGPTHPPKKRHKAQALSTSNGTPHTNASVAAPCKGKCDVDIHKPSKDTPQSTAKWKEGPLSARRKKLLQDAVAAIERGDSSKAVKVKRCRPPSWKRRAAKQARMQATEAHTCAPVNAASTTKLPVGTELPSKQANTSEVSKCSPEPSTAAATVAVRCKQTAVPAFKPAQCVLPRHSLFFMANFPRKPGFPAAHPLSVAAQSPDRTSNLKQLLVLIWGAKAPAPPGDLNRLSSLQCTPTEQRHMGACPSNVGMRVPAQPQVRLNFQQQILVSQLLNKMTDKASKLPWKALVDFYCPAPVLHPPACRKRARLALDHGSSETCASVVERAVCGFLKAVLKRLVPRELLGSARNKRLLCAWALRIACMGRFEDVSLHCVLQGMHTKDIHWLHATEERVWPQGGSDQARQRREHAAKQQQLGLLVWWLYGGVVMSVLRTFFFITDSQPLKGALVFYRKPMWRRMESEAIQRLTGTMLEECPKRDVMTQLYHRELGAAHLRHWPRMRGMRPIADLSRPTRLPPCPPVSSDPVTAARKRPKHSRTPLTGVEELSNSEAETQAPKCGAHEQPSRPQKQHVAPVRKHFRKRKRSCGHDHPGAPAAGQQRNVPSGSTNRGTLNQVPVAGLSDAGGPAHTGQSRAGPIVLRPINKVLEPIHAALKTELALHRHCSSASSSVHEEGFQEGSVSLTEAHEQLKSFQRAWRASGRPPLSMLAFDVSKAFDNVDAACVEALLQQLVTSPGWKLHKLHSTVWARGALVTRYTTLAVPRQQPTQDSAHQQAAQGHQPPMHPGPATKAGAFTALDALLSAVPAAGAPRVVTDTGTKSELSPQRFWQLMQDHLYENYVCLRSRWYRQRRGIPQGSITSPFLCNLYLSHLQRTLLSPLLRCPNPPERLQASDVGTAYQHTLRISTPDPQPQPLSPAHHGDQQTSSEAYEPTQTDDHVDGCAQALHASHQEGADLVGSNLSLQTCSTQLDTQPESQLDAAIEGTQPDCILQMPPPLDTVDTVSMGKAVSHIPPTCPVPGDSLPCTGQQLDDTSEAPFIHREPAPAAPLLMRMADDFLLVSPMHAVAEAVCGACVHELPMHGVSVSADKLVSNVTLQALHGATCSHHSGEIQGDVQGGGLQGGCGNAEGKQPRSKIPWCGLLVDSKTLAVEVDYERLHGMRVCDLINVSGTKPKALPDKMCLLLSVRLQPILLDVEMNGSDVVARNVHVAVAFAAMKFHRFVRALASKHLLAKPNSLQAASGGNSKARHTAADRSALRQACRHPAQLFKTPLDSLKPAHNNPEPDSTPDPKAPTPTTSELLQEPSDGFRWPDTDKLAAAVLGRVLPYACSTCMRCNKHSDAALTRSDLELLVLAAFMRVLQRRHTWYRCTLQWMRGCVRHPRLTQTRSRWANVTGDLNALPEELRSLKW